MYNQTLHRDRFLSFFLRCFVSAKTLEININDCLEISGKQMTKMAKKSETVNIKNHAKKI